jgi:phosphatidylinositol alpha-1,6-mannosyltransferase
MKEVEKKNKDEIIFVTISRLVERKNHMETIKALDIYRKKYNKKIKYHIVGDGEYKDTIFNFIKNKNFEFVEMHGRLNKDEKNSLLYTADYFLMISKVMHEKHEIEGFGMAFIEANSYGIPVLGGNLGGEKDSIEVYKTGLTCGPHHTEIMSALEKLEKLNWDFDYIRKSVEKYNWRNQVSFFPVGR